MTIAIIGAGLSGLTCAATLKESGRDVVVFDKGRGPGGRMSTRRAATSLGEVRFDHGCQYFTARSTRFQTAVSQWVEAGAAAPWQGRIGRQTGPGTADFEEVPQENTRWVGTPGMNSIIRHISYELHVSWARRVRALNAAEASWTLTFEDAGVEGPFDTVLLAVPAEQVGDILEDLAPALTAKAQRVQSAPCWTLMAAFDDRFSYEWAGIYPYGPVLAWACLNQSKPGRGSVPTWVVQASAMWSKAHLEDAADDVAEALFAEFSKTVANTKPIHLAAHRWRFAFPHAGPEPVPAAFDATLRIGTCGDWHVAPNVEGAWTSGRALADLVVTQG